MSYLVGHFLVLGLEEVVLGLELGEEALELVGGEVLETARCVLCLVRHQLN